ncbi:hypothetical protein LTR56_020540 [Elasticomyces elasticus]|nr:hypothetical protein LTR56_020540 [Elasticomyces elasticus]KAK3655853.1 hypothetical protein LTR22_010148 [Elasticomyces elasticus]KAK4925809.1 hypothetical protein LTR49_007185 [Elasticomyces elasticus]KAK5764762.1 hypothetical protein LTS12_005031 [Elasticomyces elasticus]
MEIIQMKTSRKGPVEYGFTSKASNRMIFQKLPVSSPLYRLLLDHYLPRTTLCQLLSRAQQLSRCLECNDCKNGRACADDNSHPDVKSRTPPHRQDMCYYHEHESEEERHLCDQKWKRMEKDKLIVIC